MCVLNPTLGLDETPLTVVLFACSSALHFQGEQCSQDALHRRGACVRVWHSAGLRDAAGKLLTVFFKHITAFH
jgi:hypothetical protein